MADNTMPNIDIRDFPAVSAADLSDFVVLSLFSGTSARMSVGLFRSSVTQGIRPYIGEGGYWYVGEASTDVLAEGRTPELRKTSTSIEYKYTSEGDDSWRPLVHFSDLRLQFDDLTPEQYELLKLKPEDLTPEDIALLQKPALDTIDRLEQTERDMLEAEAARKDAENLRSEEFASLKQDMEDAVAHTQQAAESAEDTAQHPTRIGEDNYVYTWNKLTREYERTDIYVKGDRGEGGPEPVIEYGTTTTLPPGEDASAELLDKGLDEEGRPVYLLSLSIPKGDKGESGEGTGNVLVAEEGLLASRTYLFQPSSDGSAEGRFVEYAVPDIDTSSFVTGEQLSEALEDYAKASDIPSRVSQLENDAMYAEPVYDTSWNYKEFGILPDGFPEMESDLELNTSDGGLVSYIRDVEIQYNEYGGITGVSPTRMSQIVQKVNGATADKAGFMTAQDKVKLDGIDMDAKQDKPLVFTNSPAGYWVSDLTYADYPYRCDITCPEVDESMYAEVVFDMAQAVSGDYAPICRTRYGTVCIWSRKSDRITVPTIIVTRI